ncbi:MAG: hypothetical protein UHJ11_04495 [Paludibacteraceae bacterium]|nr:hypothetical protein [Paludibacteraceae bacterium]
MINKISEYIEIHEDKFRNKMSITQRWREFCWKDSVPSHQRTLNNSFNLEYIDYDNALFYYFDLRESDFRVEKCEGNIKIILEFENELRSDIKREQLILRLNDSQNVPLEFAYYDIVTVIDNYGNLTGKWKHKCGFEIPVDLLKVICDANMVEDNSNSGWLWQTNARLIYNIAIDNQKYNDELVNLFESISQIEEEEEQYEKQFKEDTDRLYKLIKEKDKFIGHGVGYNCTVDEFIRKFCRESSFSETSEKLNDLIPLREELDEILRSKYPERYEEDTYLNVLKAADSYIMQELDKKQKKRFGLIFGIIFAIIVIFILVS